MNETDADMGTVTDSDADRDRPWTLVAASAVFWLLATGLVAAGLWGVAQLVIGEVSSTQAALGVAVAAWLIALYYWFLGRRLWMGRNAIAQAVFNALLWLPVGYYLREAGLSGYGLAAWVLAAVMLVLVLAPATRKATDFGEERRPFGETGE
ncbi:hypothetical protein [Glycomyces buryatensis]|uniref:Uncharacterized protein n=1 Tax=Glycomyces buryatensis TaxID=2570927 RepID=A0A4S8PVY8_9ACTN|nr:hypothetical protein [Glycomyces buryatensis]THV35767.1 hypothetical protein FAB82_23130 [Glycomyces buryatensis]